jgi:hypothetical protein
MPIARATANGRIQMPIDRATANGRNPKANGRGKPRTYRHGARSASARVRSEPVS